MARKRRLIYQINQARHTMMKAMDTGCYAHLGISATQLTALMVLKEHEDCLMKELANVLMLDNSAVTGLAKRMIANELIIRSPCPRDSRASRLSLSDKGENLLLQGMSLLKEVNAKMNQGFDEAELDTVSRYLQHVTRIFSTKSD